MLNDPFATLVALLPLATYLLLLGAIRLIGRPLVTTGTRDGAALALAISGLVVVGPMQLFFPAAAASSLGWWVWMLLALLYFFGVTLLLFSFPQRIIIYGVRPADVLPPLEAAARMVDPTTTSDPERMQVALEERRVRLRIEPLGRTDAIAIEAFEKHLHSQFWDHLLRELRARTGAMRRPPSLGGAGMLATGAVLMGIVIYQIVAHPTEILARFGEWLNL